MNENIKIQIEDARASIQSLQNQQHVIFDDVKKIIDSNLEEWLWEYCFNCEIGTASEDYTKHCREKLYGIDK